MNIMDLKRAVDAAIERGIDPQCAVVIAGGDIGPEWGILAEIEDPSLQSVETEGVIWFTLFAGEEADSRFTPGHFRED